MHEYNIEDIVDIIVITDGDIGDCYRKTMSFLRLLFYYYYYYSAIYYYNIRNVFCHDIILCI